MFFYVFSTLPCSWDLNIQHIMKLSPSISILPVKIQRPFLVLLWWMLGFFFESAKRNFSTWKVPGRSTIKQTRSNKVWSNWVYPWVKIGFRRFSPYTGELIQTVRLNSHIRPNHFRITKRHLKKKTQGTIEFRSLKREKLVHFQVATIFKIPMPPKLVRHHPHIFPKQPACSAPLFLGFPQN